MGQARRPRLLHQLGQTGVSTLLVLTVLELLVAEVDLNWLVQRASPDLLSRHVVKEGTRRHLRLRVHEHMNFLT